MYMLKKVMITKLMKVRTTGKNESTGAYCKHARKHVDEAPVQDIGHVLVIAHTLKVFLRRVIVSD